MIFFFNESFNQVPDDFTYIESFILIEVFPPGPCDKFFFLLRFCENLKNFVNSNLILILF